MNDTIKYLKQKLISNFPSLYILSKRNDLKSNLITIKGYKSIKKNNLFDIGYYLRENRDVMKSGHNPLMHYLYHGYRESRNPSPEFDTNYYLKYDDVKKSNLNPLVHYSLYGINEGRKICGKKETLREQLKKLEVELEKEKTNLKKSENKLIELEKEKTKLLTLITHENLQKTNSLKLNIGCGNVKFSDWINIDIDPGADLVVDLRNGLPLNDNSADFIYNEHFIEHLQYEDGEKVLMECYRVLKKKGVLRIATPNLDHVINKYLNDWKDQDWLSWPGHEYIKTKGQMINISMRNWGHEYLYNEEDLTNLLKKVGFQKIIKQDLHKSHYSELSNLETREDSTLVLEAEK